MASGISPAAVQHADEIPETRQFTAPASSPPPRLHRPRVFTGPARLLRPAPVLTEHKRLTEINRSETDRFISVKLRISV
jgi:hypothetical protein